MKRERRTAEESTEVVLRVCDLFFREQLSATEISQKLNREGVRMSRELVYHYLQKARSLNVLRLVSPSVSTELVDRLSERFRIPSDRVSVVGTQGTQSNSDYVVERAADVVRKMILTIGAEKRAVLAQPRNMSQDRGGTQRMNTAPAVGIGLGTGSLSLDFARCLSRAMLTHLEPGEPPIPKCNLHALGAACPPTFPQYNPMSFFALFNDDLISNRTGIFAEPLVPWEEFERMRIDERRFGFYTAYQKRDQIDIVVTSMGSFEEPYDLYRRFLTAAGYDVDQLARDYNICGNVQFRPFTYDGRPLIESELKDVSLMRPTTLFELSDLAAVAQDRDRRVVLVVRRSPSRDDQGTDQRARALLPILNAPKGDPLRVFSHLILDATVASAVLNLPG